MSFFMDYVTHLNSSTSVYFSTLFQGYFGPKNDGSPILGLFIVRFMLVPVMEVGPMGVAMGDRLVLVPMVVPHPCR